MRFAALDGWRGVGAILVAIVHFEAYSHLYGLSFFRDGSLLVDFFFVLSGFVIAHAYGDRLGDLAACRDFAIRRTGRLWPLQAATLLACLALEGIRTLAILVFSYPAESAPFSAPAFQIGAILRNLALIQALGFDKAGTLNLSSWSISVEMYTYLAFAAFCLAVQRRRVPVAIAIAVAAALILALLTDGVLVADPFRYGIFRAICEFFVGYLVYRLRGRYRLSTRAAAIMEGPVILLVVIFICSAGHGPLTMAAPLVFALMVYVFAFEAGALSRLMKSRWFQRAGAWSYSIYMIHMPVLRLLALSERAWAKELHGTATIQAVLDGNRVSLWSFGGVWGTDLALLAYLATVVALACLSYRWIERPGQRVFAVIARRGWPAAASERPQVG